ncbi:xanthine dehydrogenase family protein molybdopterin-binding subunit [Aliikangiella sp. G2MR2-5]|uniref:xanthine dehydrogenase family protein molybdopterin-binding subunit n=1 Tax=Aliikangiella sp. G2MR2-5 TaxID=2788943 RepID=UPI0018AC377F|nr:xanthine dehydrogenase family protein molybdopterin-binding subunit [Aliikangiella sp. G2MR2-5]
MNLFRFIPQPLKVSRRQFIRVSSLAGAGFAIGGISLPLSVSGKAAEDAPEKAVEQAGYGHFIKITPDNKVTVVIKHLDKGQGVTTGLTAIVAEELDASWEQMHWEFAPADATKYNNLFWGPVQGTGGSSSIANSWMQLRQAGAAARQLLIQAAAKKWKVSAADISVSQGRVKHTSGKSFSFGELANLAAQEIPPQNPVLKNPAQFTLIGTPHIPRIDSKEKSRGKAQYTIDVKLPGMLRAVILHPPRFGATIKSVDKTAAMKIKGVRQVVETPRGVGVIADSYWTALQARNVLKVDWDESLVEKRSSSDLWREYKDLAKKEGGVVRNDGDVNAAFNNADKTIELAFEFPYLAHATMEPLNCTVQIKGDHCEIWTGSQIQTLDQGTLAQITGLPLSNIKVNTQFAGGSFGRRAVPDSDFVLDAALIAKASGLNVPIAMQWAREDDMRGGRYRPMAYHTFKAAIDKKGNLSAWHQRVVSQSLLRGTPFEGMIQGPVDPTITEGGHTLPYHIENLKVDAHEAKVGIPILWWRSVGHTHNAFATEVFFDEVARSLEQDPVEFRLKLLKDHPRHAGVLKLAAEKAGWGKKLPANKSRGVAVHESFNSFVAQVAEVTVNKNGSFKVDKIVCAVDCGIAVTPDVIKAQMEGGIGFGLGAVLGEQITIADGKVEQSNFFDYFPMRMENMPEIEVHIVKSAEAPTGVGEPGTPPAGPAVANALRHFSKKPITVLPIGNKIDLA